MATTTKTLLQLVNDVREILREDSITVLNVNDSLSLLIVQWINQGKDEVEGAHQWERLKTLYEEATTGSQLDLTLAVGGGNSAIVKNRHGQAQLYQVTDQGSYRRIRHIMTKPELFRQYQPLQDNDQVVAVAPIRGVSTWTFLFSVTLVSSQTFAMWIYEPQADLEEADEIITVPWRPVLYHAVAAALDERGEELGISPTNYIALAAASLATEIGRDWSAEMEDFQMVVV